MILRKTISSILYLLAVTVLAFFLSMQLPGDPAETIANIGRENQAPPEIVEQVRRDYGLDQSFLTQYIRWMERLLFDGDLGRSLQRSTSVTSELARSLPASLRLGAITFLVSVTSALLLGTLSALTSFRWLDNLIQGFSVLGYAVPVFLVSSVLLWGFSAKLQLLPSIGTGTWQHYILPVTSLSIYMIAWNTPIFRSCIREAAGGVHLTAARAKGVYGWRLLWRHILKPAAPPILTSALLMLGNLISGSFIVEVIFAWNGMGRMLIDAVMGRDFPMIQGAVLVIGLIYIVLNFLIDIGTMMLNPLVGRQLQGDVDA